MSAAEILKALTAGHAAKQREHAVKEQLRLGTLSGGGSAGAVLADGTFVGKCARLAMLRAEGVSAEHGEDSLSMFEGGAANEVIVADLLTRGGLSLKRDVELEYSLSDGRKVSSHLDFVVYNADGTPSYVIETKSVCSIWTAKGTHYELSPKSDHLIQLGHYISQLGTPGVLLYSSRVDWHLSTAPRWLQSKFEVGAYDVEFKDDGTPLKIRPFERSYDVWFDDSGFLFYMTAGLDKPVRTKLTKAAITKYYATVSAALKARTLPSRPTDKHVDGSKAYLPCTYCPLAATCDSQEAAGKFDVWKDYATAALSAHAAVDVPKLKQAATDRKAAAIELATRIIDGTSDF
jgi:hypothetical protein